MKLGFPTSSTLESSIATWVTNITRDGNTAVTHLPWSDPELITDVVMLTGKFPFKKGTGLGLESF